MGRNVLDHWDKAKHGEGKVLKEGCRGWGWRNEAGGVHQTRPGPVGHLGVFCLCSNSDLTPLKCSKQSELGVA